MSFDSLLLATIALALVFDFLGGHNSGSIIVATPISSGALNARPALILAGFAELIGPLVLGVAVAGTIGTGIVYLDEIPLTAVTAMVLGALTWTALTYWFGIPSSPSHALIGALVGAATAAGGMGVVNWVGLVAVALSLLAAPVLGLMAGWLVMSVLLFLLRGASPHVNVFFKRSQALTSFMLGMGHGTNNAQMTMAVITMALAVSGAISDFAVPHWVVIVSAVFVALGVASGGWRTIHTVGAKFYRIRPIHGFTAQASSTAVLVGAALLGTPVSSSQVVSSSIIGVGSAERVSKVRWHMVGQFLVTWIITIPASAVVGALAFLLLAWFTGAR